MIPHEKNKSKVQIFFEALWSFIFKNDFKKPIKYVYMNCKSRLDEHLFLLVFVFINTLCFLSLCHIILVIVDLYSLLIFFILLWSRYTNGKYMDMIPVSGAYDRNVSAASAYTKNIIRIIIIKRQDSVSY